MKKSYLFTRDSAIGKPFLTKVFELTGGDAFSIDTHPETPILPVGSLVTFGGTTGAARFTINGYCQGVNPQNSHSISTIIHLKFIEVSSDVSEEMMAKWLQETWEKLEL